MGDTTTGDDKRRMDQSLVLGRLPQKEQGVCVQWILLFWHRPFNLFAALV